MAYMADEQSQNPENFPSAPPPPQEVKIRTMRSDLASMAQSGGGLPQFQTVRIDLPREQQATRGQQAPENGGQKIGIGKAIAILTVVAILALVAYFALIYLKK